MMFQIKDCKTILILGAGHGIGLAIVSKILAIKKSDHEAVIFATYRRKEKAEELLRLVEANPNAIKAKQINACEESEVEAFCTSDIAVRASLDLFINCIGLLHEDKILPEKTVKQFDLKSTEKIFKTNTYVTPLFAKHLMPLLRKSPLAVFSAISAKVGSISDNRMGGWYSYRASKAALNMILKNLANEFRHRNISCIVLAIHPGTTITDLSKPFIANTKYKLHSPEETANNICAVIDGKSTEDTGRFFSWDGEELEY